MTSFSLFDKKGEFFAVLHVKYFVSAHSFENFDSGFSVSVKTKIFFLPGLEEKANTMLLKDKKRKIKKTRVVSNEMNLK
jgi:hypothetical protein